MNTTIVNSQAKQKSTPENFAGFANGFVIHQRSLNRFLQDYHGWYTRRQRRSTPWLPVTWKTKLSGVSSAIDAKLQPMTVKILPETNKIQLIIKINQGTFDWQDNSFAMKDWTIDLTAPIKFDQASQITADPCVYYQDAYGRLEKHFKNIHKIAIDLQNINLEPSSEDLDFGEQQLSEEQKQAFIKHLQLLLQPIDERPEYVLMYLGADRLPPGDMTPSSIANLNTFVEQVESNISQGVKTDEIKTLDIAKSDKSKSFLSNYFYYYPQSYHIQADHQKQIYHIGYKTLLLKDSGAGIYDISSVRDDTEGLFCIGAEAFFRLLTRRGIANDNKFDFQTDRQGKVVNLSIDERTGLIREFIPEFNIQLVRNKESDIQLKFSRKFHVSRKQQLPDPFYKTWIEITAIVDREYDVSLQLNQGKITIDSKQTKNTQKFQFKAIDEHGNEQGGDEINASDPLFGSIVAGEMNQAVQNYIKDKCLGGYPWGIEMCFKFYGELTTILINIGHALYNSVQQHLLRIPDLDLPLNVEESFLQLLSESFEYRKMRFDDRWNLIFDINVKR